MDDWGYPEFRKPPYNIYIYICIYIWDIVCRYVWGYASDIIMGFRAPETGISHDSVSQHFSGPTINNRGYQYVYL